MTVVFWRTAMLRKPFMLWFLFTFLVEHVGGYFALSELKWEQTTSENGEKVWHNYVREFLYLFQPGVKYDNNTGKISHCYICSLRCLSSASNMFVHLSKMEHFKVKTQGVALVSKVTGQLSQSVFKMGIFFFHCWDKYVSLILENTYCVFKWMFKLDRKLSLNLTFTSVFFSIDCKHSNLRIVNSRNLQIGFVYCWKFPKFDLFPSIYDLALFVSITQNTEFLVNCTFDVRTSNHITSILVDLHMTTNVTTQHPLSVFVLKHKQVLFTYLLQVKKADHLILNISLVHQNSLLVFDGPGIKSETLTGNRDVFSLSSFQCFIVLMYMNSTSTATTISRFLVSFTSEPLTSLQELQVRSVLDMISSDVCDTNPCIVSFRAQNNNHINLTVLALHYVGENSPNCTHGGLLTVEAEQNNFEETAVLCSLDHRKSYYSQNSSLSLVLYYYQNYSALNATIRVAVTKCSSIHLSNCEFLQKCGNRGKQNIICTSYLADITQGSSVFLRPQTSHLLFCLPTENCFVLQISRNISCDLSQEGRFRDICYVTLTSAVSHEPDLEMVYNIKGSFSHLRIDTNYVKRFERIIHQTEGVKIIPFQNIDSVEFSGVAKEFCFGMANFTNCTKISAKERERNVFHSTQQLLSSVNHIFMHAKSYGMTYRESIKIMSRMHKSSTSWLDIEITKTTLSNKDSPTQSYFSYPLSIGTTQCNVKWLREFAEDVLLLRPQGKHRKTTLEVSLNNTARNPMIADEAWTTWKQNITFSDAKQLELISLPGIVSDLSLKLTNGDIRGKLSSCWRQIELLQLDLYFDEFKSKVLSVFNKHNICNNIFWHFKHKHCVIVSCWSWQTRIELQTHSPVLVSEFICSIWKGNLLTHVCFCRWKDCASDLVTWSVHTVFSLQTFLPQGLQWPIVQPQFIISWMFEFFISFSVGQRIQCHCQEICDTPVERPKENLQKWWPPFMEANTYPKVWATFLHNWK